MQKTILALTAFGLVAGSTPKATAGDSEWATAGKVLTGLFAAKVIHDIARPRTYTRTTTTTVCTTPSTVVYQQPAVVYQQPATVIYQQPQPTVVYTQPTQVIQQPVQVQQQPVQVQQPPVQVQQQQAPVRQVQPKVIQQQPVVVQQPQVVVQQPPVVIQQPPRVIYTTAPATVCSPFTTTTTFVRRSPLVGFGFGHHRHGWGRRHHPFNRGSHVSFVFR